jgi:hypothetical protein
VAAHGATISPTASRFAIDRSAGFDHGFSMRMPVVVWMVLCAGCGGSGAPARHDAGGEPAPDASADAMADASADAMPDARDPTVRIRLSSDPFTGTFEVRFYSPRNELIAMVTAPRGSVASAAMPEGGTVLVMPDPVAGDFDGVRGLFGVKPGDDIALSSPETPRGTDEMPITVPAMAGTAVYRAATRCGGGGSITPVVTARISLGCQPPLPIVVHAEDASGTVLGALRGTSSSTTSATLAGPYLAPEVVALQFTNGDRAASFGAGLVPVVGNDPMDDLSQSSSGGQLAVHETATLRMATEPAAIVDARRFNIFWSAVGGGNQQHLRVHAATDSTVTFDAAVDGLPWHGPPRYDALQRKLTLGAPPGAVAAGIDGQIALISLEPDAGQTIRWTLVIPPDVSEVVIPEFPDTRFDPSTRFGVNIMISSAQAIRASSYAGYDDFRRGVPVTLPVGSFYDVTSW